jgi:tRNA(Ser,Leu) C12 N-acetylase TAN1
MALVYWFDTLNLKTNGSVTDYSVKLTLISYIPYVNNQPDTAKVEATTNQLLELSRDLEVIWSQSKQSNGTFVVDLYRNGTAFTAVVVALVVVSSAALVGKRLLMRAAAKKKIAALPESDRDFLLRLQNRQLDLDNQPPEYVSYVEGKIDSLHKQQIIYEKISAVNNEIHHGWATY